jgi:hypothetical protein
VTPTTERTKWLDRAASSVGMNMHRFDMAR